MRESTRGNQKPVVLQKIIGRRILDGHAPGFLRRCVKDLEVSCQILVQLQNRRDVAAPITIVGCTPDRDECVVEHTSVAFHDQLMRASNEIEIVPFVEHGHNVPAKEISGAPRRQPPAFQLFRITPHEIAHGSVVGNFLLAINDPNLIQCIDRWRQSSVYRKDLVFNDGRQTQIIKDFRTIPPDVDRSVFAQTLVVESVDLRDLPTFVVPPNEGDAVGVADLEGEQEEEGLDAVVAAVDKVAEKEVVLVGAFATDFEEFDEVVELSVNVSADLCGVS